MKLFLVQHGDALPSETDPERPLSTQGQQDVQHIALFLSQAGIRVEKVFHSGKLRAQQTASILKDSLMPYGEIEVMSGISPNDDVVAFAPQLAAWQQDSMVVGHLPFMAGLVAFLLTGDVGNDMVVYQPGSVACLQRDENNSWHLNYMLRPELFSSDT